MKLIFNEGMLFNVKKSYTWGLSIYNWKNAAKT